MRKLKLLLAACAAMLSLGANAQLTDGTVYWIQDAATGQFLSQGDNWSTRAVTKDVGGLGFEVTSISDGVYTLKNIMMNTVKSSSKGLGSDLYVDNGNPAEFTLTASGDGYLVSLNGNYWVNNGEENAYKEKPLGTTTDAAAASVWKFLTKTEYDAAIQAYKDGKAASYATSLGYTASTVAALESIINDPNQFLSKDYTSSITNPTLGTNDNGWTHGTVSQRGEGWAAGDGCAEFWNGCGYATQTVSDLPNGLYKVTFVGAYRPDNKTEALKLASEKASSPAFVYANDAKTEFLHWIDVTFQANGRKDITVANGYKNSFYTYVTDGTLSLGVVADGWTAASGNNNCYSWTTFGQFTLTYYSDQVSEEDATELIASVPTGKMNADIQQTLNDAKEALQKNKSIKNYNALDAAITAANTSIANYAKVKSAIDNGATNAATLDDDGKAAYDISSVQSAYDNGSITDDNYSTYIDAVTNSLTAAAKAQTTIGSDWTLAIINPSFENDFTGWTNNGMTRQSNSSFAKTGIYYAEAWEPDGTKSVSQTINGMPAGVYLLKAHAKARGVTSAKIFGAGIDKAITIADSDADYSIEFACDANADVTIGFEGIGTKAGSSWLCVDNFTLSLVSAGLPDVTAVTGKMNATVAQAQTDAITAYEANRTVAGYNAAMAAIAAAQTSIAAYVPMTSAIAKLDAVLDAATSATASKSDYDAIKTAYNNGTITDDKISEQIIAAYEAVIPVIKSQTAACADFTFAIQNQSFEYGDLTGWTVAASSDTGVRDTSNPTYAATGSDGNYLFNTWWKGNPITQTVENLPNGQYTLTVSVASDGATIYLLANGKHNDGTETGNDEVTTYPGKDTFQNATITFLVKDGNATIGVVGGADGKAGEHKDYLEGGHWWYKADNFRLVKNRDLTDEEKIVIPTNIALYNGETEVTDAIALDATNNIVTLTPSYTPSNATEGYITWASSDENVAIVADGVVTGVAPGTATITATSTLDETVSATATVTATYPETAALAAYYENDGATRTNYTPGENIIKNGAFEYGNPYYGWTVGTGAAMSAEGFDVLTEEGNTYIKSKKGEGGDKATAIKIGWPIESGKTYVFSYKIKGNAGTSSWTATSLTNTIGTETLMIEREFNITTDWQEKKYTFTNTEGYAYLQFMARWYDAAYDDFYLAEVTSTKVEGNVDYATAAIPTANIGTGAFQYSQDAIDAANALVQGTATVDDVENAYTALTTVNAPADGQLFNVILTYGGWTYDQKAMTYMAGDRSDHGGYNIKYNAAANTNLAQAFTFTKISGNDYKMSQIDADGENRYVCTVTGGGYGNDNRKGIRTTTDASKALAVTVIPTATEGVWNLKNTEANDYIGSQDAGVYTVNSHIDFNIVETAKPSIAINTTAAGWGTVMLPFAVASLPTGVKAYTCAEVDGPTLTLAEVSAIEANKPYIIEGAWNETLTGDAQGTALNYTEGLLTGVYAEINAPVNSYVLQKQGDVVGFYKVAEGENMQPKVPANRAYLTTSSTARALYFDNATAIKAIEALTSGEAEIYNAAGARQNKLQKGVNIIKQGNKTVKVMVK